LGMDDTDNAVPTVVDPRREAVREMDSLRAVLPKVSTDEAVRWVRVDRNRESVNLLNGSLVGQGDVIAPVDDTWDSAP
jgi:hypothetical protein